MEMVSRQRGVSFHIAGSFPPKKDPDMSMYRQVGLASLIMMASVFLSRVIGLFREMVIAWHGGAGQAVDAYQVAFVIPEMLNHALASGFLSVTFIPLFSAHLARGREDEAWESFRAIFTGFGAAMIVLILGAYPLVPRLMALVAPGADNPAFLAEASRMTRIILPAQVFFFAGGLFMAVQFSKGRFFIPALAPLVYNAGIIAGGLVAAPGHGMVGFSWGVLAGSFLGNFLLQAWGAWRVGMPLHWSWNPRHPDLKRYVLLSLPLMLGLTMTFSTEFFLKFFGSFLPPGGIAGLNYGLRIMFLLVGFFGQAAGTASFPFLARLAAEGKVGEMNELLNTTLRYLAVVLPMSVLFMVLRREVVVLLFQRGRFDAAAVDLTAGVLPFLMAGAVAFAAQTVVTRGWFATRNTLFPAMYGTIAVVASLPLYILGMKWMGAPGVALAVSGSALIQVWLLYALWNRRTANDGASGVYRTCLKMTAAALVCGLTLEPLRRWILMVFPDTGAGGALCRTLVVGLAFPLLITACSRIMGIGELTEVFRMVVRRPRPKP